MTHIGFEVPLLRQAAEALIHGKPVVFPTETVYGLGADARSDHAILEIFRIKNRPPQNPTIVHVSSIDKVLLAADKISSLEHDLFSAFAPGPLTLILPKNKSISFYATGGLDTVGVRIPSHPLALKLLEYASLPVAAPSANISGKPSPTTLDMCRFYMEGRVPYIIDGGNLPIGIESTVVRVEHDKIFILRSGAINSEAIKKTIGLKPEENIDQAHRSPGTRFAHYQPKARVILFEGKLREPESEKSVAVGLQEFPDWKFSFSFDSLEDYAQALYRIFFWSDSKGIDTIYCELPPTIGIGVALRDRLNRAASFREAEE